jgi:hypothetical protein
MKAMIARVVEQGADPFAVAARYLDPEMLAAGAETERRAITVALGGLDAPAGQSARVLLALRQAFPGRPVAVVRDTDPLGPLLDSAVRYGLLSGPEFFAAGDAGRLALRGPVDALVPVGSDVLHLLVAAGGPQPGWSDGARVGVGPAGGLSARTAAMVRDGIAGADIELVPQAGDADAAFGAQAEQLRRGELDGLLVMTELGHPLVAGLLGRGLELAPIADWEIHGNRVRYPFLEPVTIPRDSYPGQAAPLVAVGSQTVLAARRPDLDKAVGVVGPGSAAIGRTLPVGAGSVARLRDALEVEARLDPSLPVANAAREPAPERPSSISPSPIGSVLNLAAVAVLALVFWLYLRRPGHPR